MKLVFEQDGILPEDRMVILGAHAARRHTLRSIEGRDPAQFIRPYGPIMTETWEGTRVQVWGLSADTAGGGGVVGNVYFIPEDIYRNWYRWATAAGFYVRRVFVEHPDLEADTDFIPLAKCRF